MKLCVIQCIHRIHFADTSRFYLVIFRMTIFYFGSWSICDTTELAIIELYIPSFTFEKMPSGSLLVDQVSVIHKMNLLHLQDIQKSEIQAATRTSEVFYSTQCQKIGI